MKCTSPTNACIAPFAVLAALFLGGSPCRPQAGNLASLADFASKLSRQYHDTVLVDPALTVVGGSIRVDASRGIETALDQLTASIPQSKWRRVIAPDTVYPECDAADLADAARTFESMAAQSILVEDVVRGRTMLLEHDVPKATVLYTTPLKAAPVYLVYSTRSSTSVKSPRPAQFKNTGREIQAILGAAPDLGAKATEASMLWWRDLDPATARPLIEKLGAAANHAWDELDAGQRDSMVQQFVQTAQRAVAELQAAPRNASQGPAAPHNYRDELEAIATSLGSRFTVPCPVDPAMFLTVQPMRPAEPTELCSVIGRLMTPLPGTSWRRVTLRDKGTQTRLDVRALARFVRYCDRQSEPLLAFVEPSSGTGTVLRRVKTAPNGSADASRVLCLLYAASVGDSGAATAPADHLADLIRQEQQMMLTMDSGQLGRAMAQRVQAWQAMDATDRATAMSQPLMAGMMAVWMPRMAKERTGR